MSVRVGVIGTGVMGTHHVRILSRLPGAELCGVYDLNAERSRAVAQRFGTTAYTDLEPLLQSVEAVVIAVSSETHFAVGALALAAGCHVLMEKPLAHNVAAGRELCRLAAEQGRMLMVGHVERFNPAVCRLREVLAEKPPLFLNFTRVGPEPPRDPKIGVILDLAIHDLDLLHFLAQAPAKRVAALMAGKAEDGQGREDTASLSFLLASGTLAQITVNWLTHYKVREIHAATHRGLYQCDLIRQSLVAYHRLPTDGAYAVQEIAVAVAEPLRAEVEAFVAAVSAGEPPPVSGEDGLRALALAEQCLREARRRRLPPLPGVS